MFGFLDWLFFTIIVCVCFFFEKHRATTRVRDTSPVRPFYLILVDYYLHGVMDVVSLQLELCGAFVWCLMWMFHELKSPIRNFWVRVVFHLLVVECLRYNLEYIERERIRKKMLESKFERDSANCFWLHQYLGNPPLMESDREEQSSNGHKVRISCRGKDSRNSNGHTVRRLRRGKDKSRSRSRHSSQR